MTGKNGRMTRRQYQRSKIPPKKPPREGMAVHRLVRVIWEAMNKDNWSQEDLAARAGVSSSAMRKWRNGERSPQLAEIEAVLGALGYRIKEEEIE